MFVVGNVYLSDDIATAQFACHLTACKGECCVRGDAGAPIRPSETAVLRKAWNLLKPNMRDRAKDVVDESGLIWGSGNDLELATTDGKECVFVEYTEDGTALCGIQKAWMEDKISWKKPLSCELFPLRIIESGIFDYINFEYIPEMCSPACTHAKENGIYLAEYLQDPLVRKYGESWYAEFLEECQRIREEEILVRG